MYLCLRILSLCFASQRWGLTCAPECHLLGPTCMQRRAFENNFVTFLTPITHTHTHTHKPKVNPVRNLQNEVGLAHLAQLQPHASKLMVCSSGAPVCLPHTHPAFPAARFWRGAVWLSITILG